VNKTQREHRSPANEASWRDRQPLRSLAVMLLLVSALFSGAVAGALVMLWLSGPSARPDVTRLDALRAQLRRTPDNEALKDLLRQEDQRLRRQYLLYQRRLRTGALLLLLGVAAAVAAARWYAALDLRPVRPSTPAERQDTERWFARRHRQMAAIGVAALAATGLWLVLGTVRGPDLPKPAPEEAPPEPPGPGAKHTFRENWPRFRGPTGLGIVRAGAWPASFNARTGENILWKTPVPLPGNSSPVVWGDRIFLTGATEKRQEVLCFDRTDGKLLWRTAVTAARAKGFEFEVMAETGYAAPTPATDGERVYATYASADVAAVDFKGRILWARNLGPPENAYGRATSLLVYRDTVIVQFDRGGGADERLSYLVALDAKTGKDAWRTPRPVGNSWSTPVIVKIGGNPTLLTTGAPWTIAYDPGSGAEIWRVGGLSGDVAPSPVYADGLVFVTNEYAKAMAIRAGGRGDVTKSHVVWTAEEGLSDAPSPVATDRFFLQVHSSGQITCYDAKKGALLWEHQLDGAVWASPTLAGDIVYLPSEDGKVYLFELGKKYVPRGTCDVGEPLLATPAFVDGQMILRGKKHLFCIGRAPEKP